MPCQYMKDIHNHDYDPLDINIGSFKRDDGDLVTNFDREELPIYEVSIATLKEIHPNLELKISDVAYCSHGTVLEDNMALLIMSGNGDKYKSKVIDFIIENYPHKNRKKDLAKIKKMRNGKV